jgi:hypothetical protein
VYAPSTINAATSHFVNLSYFCYRPILRFVVSPRVDLQQLSYGLLAKTEEDFTKERDRLYFVFSHDFEEWKVLLSRFSSYFWCSFTHTASDHVSDIYVKVQIVHSDEINVTVV